MVKLLPSNPSTAVSRISEWTTPSANNFKGYLKGFIYQLKMVIKVKIQGYIRSGNKPVEIGCDHGEIERFTMMN